MPGRNHDRATQNNWLNVPEAAEYLGISEKTLRNMVFLRQIEFRKDGTHRTARLRFSRRALDAFVSANTVKPGERAGR